jgi:protein-disulfide isomerase
MAMSKTFDNNKDGVSGTPSFVMNGKMITVPGSQNPPMTVDQFNQLVGAALKS